MHGATGGHKTRGRIVGWELDANFCPDSDAEFRKWWRRELRRYAEPVIDTKNLALNAGLGSIAAYLANQADRPGWQTGRPYRQALGSGLGDSLPNMVQLKQEVFRKPITDTGASFAGAAPVSIFSTYFSPTDFFCPQTTVKAFPDDLAYMLTQYPDTICVVQPSGYNVGDTIRLDMAGGYEYHTLRDVQPLGDASQGGLLLLKDRPSARPPVGTLVSQVLCEGAMYGDDRVKFGVGGIPPLDPTGVASGVWFVADFTKDSTTVKIYTSGGGLGWPAGYGAPFTQDHVGEYIRLTAPVNYQAVVPVMAMRGPWYQIDSVDEPDNGAGTQTIRLHTPYGTLDDIIPEPNPGQYFEVRGTIFNRTSSFRYVKLATKGFIFENEWTLEGA